MFSWWSSDEKRLRTARRIAEHLAPLVNLPVSIQLWDGSKVSLGSEAANAFTIAIASPGVVSSMLRKPTLPNVVQHYLAGRIDFQGGNFMQVGAALRQHRAKGAMKQASRWYLLRQAWPFLLYPADCSRASHCVADQDTGWQPPQLNRKEFIEFHYDIPTAFYQLFLDPELQYTCAYYKHEREGLDQAQLNKLEHICRKLQLKPGERLLDVGCGWGGLLCYAARNYGVRGHGLTLSKEQLAFAQEKIKRHGLQQQVTVELVDYSKHEGQYDKISSVGIMEHIGIANYPTFFGKLNSLLRDRGILLNQAIARGAKATPAQFRKMRPEYKMIQKYIFPGGELGHIGNVLETLEGRHFEVQDVEAWRPHYARTCKAWCENLSANKDKAVRLVGEEIYRAWVAYLASFSFGFEDGTIRIFQTVATKHAGKGLSQMPLTREHLYLASPAAARKAS